MRPYVIVSAPPLDRSPRLFNLSIKNIGARPARNVRVTLDPPPIRAREIDGVEIAKLKMLNEPIKLIAPGQELACFYDNHGDRKDRDDLPRAHIASVTYQDFSGHSYSETMTIDLDALEGIVYSNKKSIEDVVRELEKLRTLLGEASLLGRRVRVQVDAALESRDEYLDREAYEAHCQNLADLEFEREWPNPDGRLVKRLENAIAQYETDHRARPRRSRTARQRASYRNPRR